MDPVKLLPSTRARILARIRVAECGNKSQRHISKTMPPGAETEIVASELLGNIPSQR